MSELIPVQKSVVRRGFLLFCVILVQFLLISAGTAYVLLKFHPVEPISESDLTEVRLETLNTVISVPKKWQKIDLGKDGGMAYGNEVDGSKSSGLIQVVGGSSSFTHNLSQASPESQQEYRDLAFEKIDTWTKADASCSDRKVLRKEQDTFNKNGLLGIFKFDTICKRSSGRMVVTAVRLYVGDDGRFRIVFITAHENNWNTNKDVYEKMLESVSQADRQKIVQGQQLSLPTLLSSNNHR